MNMTGVEDRSKYSNGKSSSIRIGNTNEPLDKNVKKQVSPLMFCVGEYFESTHKEDELDDGELPALSINREKKRNTTNPMEALRSDGRRKEHRQDIMHDHGNSWDDDMPDDEFFMGMETKMSPQSYEVGGYNDNNSNDKEIELAKTVSNEDNLCDFTYALDICGKGDTVDVPSARPISNSSANLRNISEIKPENDTTEEQTAIEVEYVEPPKQEKVWSPAKKNSYLAAMARKAKADFRKTAPEQVIAKNREENVNKTNNISKDKKSKDDIYSSFNATEKRKFLKMVNSGMSPTESAEIIFEERDGSSGKRGLAFWKRNKQDAAPHLRRRTKGAKSEVPFVQGMDNCGDINSELRNKNVSEAETAGISIMLSDRKNNTLESDKQHLNELDIQEKFAKSGNNYYDAVRRDPSTLDYVAEEHRGGSAHSKEKGSRQSRGIIRNPKMHGFAYLNEHDKSAEANNLNEVNSPSKTSKMGKRSKGNKLISLSPDTSPRRRFRILGNRPTRFEALVDNNDESVLDPRLVVTDNSSGCEAKSADTSKETELLNLGDRSETIAEEKCEVAEEGNVQYLEKVLLRPLDPLNSSEISIQNNSIRMGMNFVQNERDVNNDLDNYLNSASSVYLNNSDQMSVVSGRSHWTSGTTATGFTTSSRIRRPGAAKQRIAQAKKADKNYLSKNGWHDSIKEAAANSSQNWSPKTGFIDYKDPSEEIQAAPSNDPLQVNLRITKMKEIVQLEKGEESVDVRSSVPIPFSENREDDNCDMRISRKDEEDSKHLEKKDVPIESPHKKRGQAPDPEGLNSGKLVVGNVVSAIGIAAENEQKPNHPPIDGLSASSEISTNDNNENYVQLGDAGSVRAFSSNHNSDDKVSVTDNKLGSLADEVENNDTGDTNGTDEEDTAPLLAASNSFTQSNEGAEVVEVVKQKNNKDDINLFAHDSRNVFPSSPKSDYLTKEKASGSRRGHGPVDIDEIDDMDFDDEDNGQTWASDQVMKAITIKGRSINPTGPPRLTASERDTPKRKRGNAKSSSSLSKTDERCIENQDTDADEMLSTERDQSLHSETCVLPNEKKRVHNDSNTNVSVKQLAKQWESTSDVVLSGDRRKEVENQGEVIDKILHPESEDQTLKRNMEWKSFLEKKVRAESTAAAKQNNISNNTPELSLFSERRHPYNASEASEDDSLFEFRSSASEQSGGFPGNTPPLLEPKDDFSDISPIHPQEDDELFRQMESISDTGTNVEQGSFLKRLQACAAPMMPKQLSGQTIPSNICGGPDGISEEAATLPANSSHIEMEDKNFVRRSSSTRKGKQRLCQKKASSEVRSVVSEKGFGGKTSYLDAIAMKAAVSNPKRSGSKERGNEERHKSSSASDISISSRKSERWQEFLRRKTAGISPSNQSRVMPDDQPIQNSPDSRSRSSEKFAAQKVELLMVALSSSETNENEKKIENILSSEVCTLSEARQEQLLRNSPSKVPSLKNESARAAEELAAARVEAMMAAMTSQTLDEREI